MNKEESIINNNKEHRIAQIGESLKDIKEKIKETEKELTDENLEENIRLVRIRKELNEEKSRLEDKK